MDIYQIGHVHGTNSGDFAVAQQQGLAIAAAAAAASAQNFIGSAATENAPPLPPVVGPATGNLFLNVSAYTKQIASSKLIITATIACDATPSPGPLLGSSAIFQVLVNGTPLDGGATLAPDALGHMSLTLQNERSGLPIGAVSIAVTVNPSALITVAAQLSRIVVVVQEVRV